MLYPHDCDPMSFKVSDTVVYPSHGVGLIVAEEHQVIGGQEMSMYVISFTKEKMTLSVPKAKAIKAGLRHLSSREQLNDVMEVLKGNAKIAKGMWSKRAQEYEHKINSGSIMWLAEVVRDLYRGPEGNSRSYSERMIYESALERLVHEYAVTMEVEPNSAKEVILSALSCFREE